MHLFNLSFQKTLIEVCTPSPQIREVVLPQIFYLDPIIKKRAIHVGNSSTYQLKNLVGNSHSLVE